MQVSEPGVAALESSLTLRITINININMSVGYTAIAAISLASLAGASPTLTSSGGRSLYEISDNVENIVVTGSRRAVRLSDSVVNTEVFTRQEIEASGAEDLAELLEGAPGIQIDRSFAGAGIRMQGLDPEHTLILIDGQRITGRINGVIDLQRLFSERIERVEIVKGPSSALYGSDAMGGVINIITRENRKSFDASAHVAFGSLSTTGRPFARGQTNTVDSSGRVSVRGKKWSMTLLGGYHRQDAFDLSPEDEGTSGSELTSFNIELQSAYEWSDDSKIIARADYFQRSLTGVEIGSLLTQPEDNPFRPDPTRTVTDRQNDVRTFSASIQPTFSLGDAHDLAITAYFTRYEDIFSRNQRGQDTNDNTEQATDNLGQLTAQYTGSLGRSHIVVAGFEVLYEQLSTPRIFARDADRGRISFFAQDEWILFDRLTLVPGFRFDYDTQFGAFPTPKLALRFDATDNIIVRASYGIGFRSPTFRELYLRFENPSAGYFVEGNDELQPERSRGLNVGIEFKPHESVRLIGEFYRNDVRGLINFVPLAGIPGQPQPFTNDNIDEAVTQGVEASIEIALLSWMQASASYTYLDARDLTEDRPLFGRAKHRITFRLASDYQRWGLSGWLRGTYVGERPFTEATAAPYITADARLAQLIGERFKVFLGIDNIFNAGDPEFLTIPPFGVYAGLDARF
ncbi:MAG: TonB-dependent receptor [Myxococcota bacterium]